MNTKNNKKFQETEKLICNTFLELLNTKKFSEITITEICRQAGITRATFYAHCRDTRELMSRTDEMLSADLAVSLWQYNSSHSDPWKLENCLRQLFDHIKKYRQFYRIYISHIQILPLFEKLPDVYLQISGKDIYGDSHRLAGVDARKVEFHSAFFYAGMTAFLSVWLAGGCRESPDELLQLIYDQYHPGQKTPKSHGDSFPSDPKS